PVYNRPVFLRLDGDLNPFAMERAINEVVRRHDALRASFPVLDGQPRQLISDAKAFSIPIVDLSGLPEIDRENRARELAHEEARRPFDLVGELLFRVRLLRLKQTSHLLMVTMHHIVSDGWSYEVFLRELDALYRAFSEGRASPLPELVVQYPHFVRWKRDLLQAGTLKHQLRYWARQLDGGWPVLDLPIDRTRPQSPTFRGATQIFVLPENLSE